MCLERLGTRKKAVLGCQSPLPERTFSRSAASHILNEGLPRQETGHDRSHDGSQALPG